MNEMAVKSQAQDILHKVKYFILDLDGTVYLGGKLVEGVIEFLGHV